MPIFVDGVTAGTFDWTAGEANVPSLDGAEEEPLFSPLSRHYFWAIQRDVGGGGVFLTWTGKRRDRRGLMEEVLL
jgi:hypothetical protein